MFMKQGSICSSTLPEQEPEERIYRLANLILTHFIRLFLPEDCVLLNSLYQRILNGEKDQGLKMFETETVRMKI